MYSHKSFYIRCLQKPPVTDGRVYADCINLSKPVKRAADAVATVVQEMDTNYSGILNSVPVGALQMLNTPENLHL